jgi:hypothetical protein
LVTWIILGLGVASSTERCFGDKLQNINVNVKSEVPTNLPSDDTVLYVPGPGAARYVGIDPGIPTPIS